MRPQTSSFSAETVAGISNHLTPERLRIIEQTAPALVPKVADGTITTRFYQKMIDENPELRRFFNMSHQRTKHQSDASEQTMLQPKTLQSQVLAKSVLAAVEHLKNLESIKQPLQRIAHKHCALGVPSELYKTVHTYFLAATAEVLGDAVTPDVADAWSGALLHVADFLIEQEKSLYDQTTAMERNWDTRHTAEFVVQKVERSAKHMTSLYLARADGSPPPVYKPGQYITLCANPTDEKNFAPRHYTIAAPAPMDNAVRICVRHVQGGGGKPAGAMSTFVNAVVKVGDRLQLRHPFGVCTTVIAQPFEHVGWVTAGSGITMALAMAAPMAREGKRIVHWHADRDEDSVAHAEELSGHPLYASLRYYGGSKAFTVDGLIAQLKDNGIDVMNPKTAIFLCCPPAMLLDVRNGLQQRGVQPRRILYEAYGPLAN